MGKITKVCFECDICGQITPEQENDNLPKNWMEMSVDEKVICEGCLVRIANKLGYPTSSVIR